MEISELKKTHDLYNKNIDIWNRNLACYEGTDAMIDYGALYQHSRESKENYANRIKQAFSFTFSETIVDIFNQYLFKNKAQRKFPNAMVSDSQFQAFLEDCDMENTGFDYWMNQNEKLASALGHIGILVDRPAQNFNTKQEEKNAKIHPYIVCYLPQSILDWEFERNPQTGRRELKMLKLLDEGEIYLIWTKTDWKKLKIIDNAVVITEEGKNNIGEIPFFWFYNIKSRQNEIGKSDISNISRIDISILRNLSQGEEVIDLAAFPMMRKPRLIPSFPQSADDGTGRVRPGRLSNPDVVGVSAVLEFDPERPESKPDWLNSDCGSPLQAIMQWIDKKIEQIYRLSHASGILGITSEAKSGVALEYEFTQLSMKLAAKSDNLTEAEYKIFELWLKWQGSSTLYPEIEIHRSKDFSVRELSNLLSNILLSSSIVRSETFRKYAQKQAAISTFPEVPEDLKSKIEKEIDSQTEPVIPENEEDNNSNPDRSGNEDQDQDQDQE